RLGRSRKTPQTRRATHRRKRQQHSPRVVGWGKARATRAPHPNTSISNPRRSHTFLPKIARQSKSKSAPITLFSNESSKVSDHWKIMVEAPAYPPYSFTTPIHLLISRQFLLHRRRYLLTILIALPGILF